MCGPPKPEPGHKSFEEAIRLNQDFSVKGKEDKGCPRQKNWLKQRTEGGL